MMWVGKSATQASVSRYYQRGRWVSAVRAEGIVQAALLVRVTTGQQRGPLCNASAYEGGHESKLSIYGM
jgi:hypothetical protein